MYARPLTRPKPPKVYFKSFPSLIGGWVSNRNLAQPNEPGMAQGAVLLDNFLPRSSTVQLRRGRTVHAELPTDPLSIFSYKDGTNEKLFSATTSTIYDVTTSTPASVLAGKTSGDWSVVQFATTGGVFLVGVNGTDTGFIYDGATFASLAVTFSGGLTTADMTHVWIYKNRLWFAQKNSMDAHYAAVDSIAGPAVLLPLGGVFGKGGSLLFGQTWSLDAGSEGGLSEQNIFVSTEGEVAVFQGSDPAVATDWRKVGVYRIGTPLGKNAFIRGGGDIAIATSVGLVPLSKAISLDITSLNVATISYNIADAWSDAVAQRGLTGWACEIWPEQKIAFVSPPDPATTSYPVAFVSSTETGAWCRFTNWRMTCMEVFRGILYFGSTAGKIYKALDGGLDDGAPYTGIAMPLFDDLGSPGSLKIGKRGRNVTRSLGPVNDMVVMRADFDLTPPAAPSAISGTGSSLWGSGIWSTSIWGSTVPDYISQNWDSVGGSGYALSLMCQITSGSSSPLDSELIRQELTYTVAALGS